MAITESQLDSACSRLLDKMTLKIKNSGGVEPSLDLVLSYLENYLTESLKDESGIATIGDIIGFNKEMCMRRTELDNRARKTIVDACKAYMIEKILCASKDNIPVDGSDEDGKSGLTKEQS